MKTETCDHRELRQGCSVCFERLGSHADSGWNLANKRTRQWRGAERERDEARAEARRYREALERLGKPTGSGRCLACDYDAKFCDRRPYTDIRQGLCPGAVARRALATTSKPAGELDPVAWPHPCRACGGFGGHESGCRGDHGELDPGTVEACARYLEAWAVNPEHGSTIQALADRLRRDKSAVASHLPSALRVAGDPKETGMELALPLPLQTPTASPLTCVGLVGGGESALSAALKAAASPSPAPGTCEPPDDVQCRCGHQRRFHDFYEANLSLSCDVSDCKCISFAERVTGMQSGQRCTKLHHRGETPHEHDVDVEGMWATHPHPHVRCPYVHPTNPQANPQAKGTTDV